MSDDSERIEQLERRVQRLEDHIALLQALATYGPSVDSMELNQAVDLWAPDGIYDLGDGFEEVDSGHGHVQFNGQSEIREMLHGPIHWDKYVRDGCAHDMSLPLLGISGDRAVGIGYHTVFAYDSKGARAERLAASRWDWKRQASGEWKAVRRTHRLLDGREGGRALLKDALEDIKKLSAPQ
ncbi:nuclear transport factor 2 family protein [Paenarthrobacter nicotinovorans]|uniref:nuclear transport factor 2 family protein n=1 Tax=Paenarthrobacter nicotinovorans TaxID=29320 RepID=UPI00382D9B13